MNDPTETTSGGRDAGDIVPGYRPMSPWAVAAVVFGAASAVAILGPALWVVPIIGLTVSVAALADTGQRAGRLAAVAGLALSLGFGAQAVATLVTSEWIARGRAEAAVRIWLEAIAAGRLDDARAMCGLLVEDSIGQVAACRGADPPRIRCRDVSTAGRIVRVAVGDCAFDVVIGGMQGQSESPQRLLVEACTPVTPSGN